MGSPHLSLINMEVYKCGLSNVFKDNHTAHIRIYVYTMQAVADDYILTLYPIYVHFTFSLGENNGLFRGECNETEEVSIYQFILLLSTNVM